MSGHEMHGACQKSISDLPVGTTRDRLLWRTMNSINDRSEDAATFRVMIILSDSGTSSVSKDWRRRCAAFPLRARLRTTYEARRASPHNGAHSFRKLGFG